MIRIIDKSNIHQFPKTMDQQFRLRHAVFVKEKGWKDFEKEGVYEKDQYDNDNATYVISIDSQGDAIGCFRLYPTMLPHMLSETFPNLVEGSVTRRPDVYEITRFHLSKAARQTTAWLELVAAIAEVGLDLGLSGVTGLTRTLRIPAMQAAGLSIRPTGLPVFMDGESNVSVIIDITEQSLSRINLNRGSTASVLERNLDRRDRA
ncbi:MAG: autoinducer synthesis protein [Tardiphaga sp.]|nr:autoinducer synthesis protein [Tardiphaga sp.]